MRITFRECTYHSTSETRRTKALTELQLFPFIAVEIKNHLNRVGGSEGACSDEGRLQVRRGKRDAQQGSAAARTQKLRRHVEHIPLLAQPRCQRGNRQNNKCARS